MVGPCNDVASMLYGSSLTHSCSSPRTVRAAMVLADQLRLHAPGVSSPSVDVLAPEESSRSAGSSTSTLPSWPFSLKPACRPVGRVCMCRRLDALKSKSARDMNPHLQVLSHVSRQSVCLERARPSSRFEQALQAPGEICRVVLLPSLPAAAEPWYLL